MLLTAVLSPALLSNMQMQRVHVPSSFLLVALAHNEERILYT